MKTTADMVFNSGSVVADACSTRVSAPLL